MGNPGPQGVKGFQVSCMESLIISLSCCLKKIFLVNLDCACHVLQGVKGALGDPGLPGPTGIRGEFGERVSLTCDDMKCVPFS